jgi:hypothetical protein
MNFGSILNSITLQCVNLMLEGREDESKTLAKKFTTYVNLKAPLKNQFYAYSTLREATITNPIHADLLVKETMNLFNDFTIEDLKNYNALLEYKFKVQHIDSTKTDKDITRVIQSTIHKTGYNAIAKNKSYISLIEHVQSEHKQRNLDDLKLNANIFENSTLKYLKPNSVVRIAIKKFNSEFLSEFDTKEKEVFITLSSKNSKNIIRLKRSLIAETTLLVEGISDEDLKSKALEAIDKVKSSENIRHSIIDIFYMNKELHTIG